MYFVNKKNCFGSCFVKKCFQSLLKFAPVFRSRNECAQVKPQHPRRTQLDRNITRNYPLSKSLNDSRFSDAGISSKHRVILAPPKQCLNQPVQLRFTACQRIKLPPRRPCGKVIGIAFQHRRTLSAPRLIFPAGYVFIMRLSFGRITF